MTSHITIHLPSLKSYEYRERKYHVEYKSGREWIRYDTAIPALGFDEALELARDVAKLSGAETRLEVIP